MTINLVRSIAVDLGISIGVTTRIASTASQRYKVFNIPKRGRAGGQRTIAQPAREVKALQRALVRFLSSNLPVHPRAQAYQKGSSILANAQIHSGARFLLKMDFSAFFPSIQGDDIEAHLIRHYGEKISRSEIYFIQMACLWRTAPDQPLGLCIGAPSSPFLSNSIMYEFDLLTHNYCIAQEVEYSRYSDDLTFSSRRPEILRDVESHVREIVGEVLTYPRLGFNERKRVSVSRGSAMLVTGLTLSNQGAVTVGRARKRGVRAGINDFTMGRLGPDRIARLRGEISFVLSIEPNFREVLVRTYGNQIFGLL